MYALRDYQVDGKAAVLKELETHRSTAVIWATGLGKTRLAAELIQEWHPAPTMFICERQELVWQTAEKIKLWTGLDCAIEQGGYRVAVNELWGTNRPVIASIQSLNSNWGQAGKRMQKFKPAYVICDEAHHSTAPTYEKFFNYIGPQTKLVGLTATPKRLDGKAIGKHFETVAHLLELREAIQKGWLCDIAQEVVEIMGLDYSKIKTVRGDLDTKQLAQQLEPEEMVQRMVMPSLEIIYGVTRGSLATITPDKWGEYLVSNQAHPPFRTIMFCVSVAQAELTAKVFNRAVGDKANWICGKHQGDDRENRMNSFRSGAIPIITNCGVLGEGVDVPETELILQARPTKSLSLWVQQLGRGTRTLPGVLTDKETPEERIAAIKASAKKVVRVVDFAGNSGRHHLITSVDVLGGDLPEDVRSRALADAVARKGPVRMVATLVNAKLKIDQETKEALKRAEENHKRHLLASVNYTSHEVSPFKANGHSSPWFKRTATTVTPPQQKLLRWAGMKDFRGLSKKVAGFYISKIKWVSDGDRNHPQLPQWIRDKHNGKATA